MNLKTAVWTTAAAGSLLLPAVASSAGYNRFARAYLSWSPASRASDTTIASPKTPTPLFLIIEGAGDLRSVSAVLRWLPDGSTGAGYSLVAPLLPSPYPDYATLTPPAEVRAGDALAPYNSTIVMADRSAARHAIAYWFVRTAPTAVRASFYAYLIRITDSAGQEDTLAITGAATVGGGAPRAGDPGLRRIVPSALGIDFWKGAVVDGPLTSATPGEFRFRSSATAGLLSEVGIVRLRSALGRPSRAYENATNILGEPVKLADLSGSYVAELHPDSLELRAAARLQSWPDVQGCTPLHPGVPMRSPTDSLFGMQWGLANHATVPCGNPVAGADIGAEAAWDVEIAARPAVRVGVFDSGVARDHPEFTERLEAGPCTAWPQNCVYGSDYDDDEVMGHGTAVAGIIAARGNNVHGTTGVAWDVTPVSFKHWWGDELTLAAAIDSASHYPADRPIWIYNVSYGYSDSSDAAFRGAFNNAFLQGHLVVASSGNDNNNRRRFPAAFKLPVVSVGALLPDGTRWEDAKTSEWPTSHAGSNYGPTVDFAAPGGEYVATTLAWPNNQWNPLPYRRIGYYGLSDCYDGFGGTSAAAPVVAGAAALLLSYSLVRDTLAAEDIERILSMTARDMAPPGRDDSTGAGLVRVDEALRWLDDFRRVEHQQAGGLSVVERVPPYLMVFYDCPVLWFGTGQFLTKRYMLRETVRFRAAFADTPVAWVRASGTIGVTEESPYRYNDRLYGGHIVAGSVSSDSCVVETYVYEIYDNNRPLPGWVWFPTDTLGARVALTAIGRRIAGVAVEPGGGAAGDRLVCTPNLVRAGARLEFEVARKGWIRLTLYDVAGRRVREIYRGWGDPGWHAVRWDGRDEGGARVGPGVYFCRMEFGGRTVETRRLVVLAP